MNLELKAYKVFLIGAGELEDIGSASSILHKRQASRNIADVQEESVT